MPTLVSPWKLDGTDGEGREVYRRPLGNTELGFYWDHVYKGTATTVQHLHVEVDEGREEMLSKRGVERAWIHMKRHYPLLGAQLDEHPDAVGVDFVVREEDLNTVRGDVRFVDVDSVDEVHTLTEQLMNGPNPLTNDRIALLYVLRQKNIPRQVHILAVLAHMITDGMAAPTLARTLCQELSSPSNKPIPALCDRLEVVPALEDLYPSNFMNTARRRWHRAIARVIYDIRNTKLQGGHTLPMKVSPRIPSLPALTRSQVLELPVSTSLAIIETCRKLGITFGNALPVLSQVAHSRILHRLRFIQDAIGDSEWDHRLKQPMHFAGPLNLRPYLDQDWYKNKGGSSVICLAISFYNYVLPSLPRSHLPSNQWNGRFPPFESLLPDKRFLHRSQMICRQTAATMKHPLFVDITACRGPGRVARARGFGVGWRAEQNGESPRAAGVNNTNVGGDVPFVFSNGGASLGNREALLPYSYPTPSTTTAEKQLPSLRIVHDFLHLRCRPTELYLGALTSRGKLMFFLYWDSNVYSDDLVREWAEQVRAAAVHYLGQSSEDISASTKTPVTTNSKL